MATVVALRVRPAAPVARTEEKRVKLLIEDEPEFVLFMNYLLEDAHAHPDRLTPAADALSGLHELLAGVEPDL